MKDIKEIEKELTKHKHELFAKFKIKKLGLFGSYVTGEQKKNSDLDILVEFTETPGMFKYLNLEESLENIIGINVDLVMKTSLKQHIEKQILSEVVYL
ncbi:MAG: nucleotidyltransferase family protein [Candidatus Micrarchaeota archaeon]